MTAGGSGPDQKSILTRATTNAVGRAGHEIDMAATILFLAGRGGTFYTAQTLFPDGGELFRSKMAGFTLTRLQARPSLKQHLSSDPYYKALRWKCRVSGLAVEKGEQASLQFTAIGCIASQEIDISC